MPNCKAGDIAVIIGSHCTENLGRFVTVLGRALPGVWGPGNVVLHPSADPQMVYWFVEANSALACLLMFDDGSLLAGVQSNIAIFRDAWLMPIRPPAEDSDTIESKELEHVE